MASEQRRATGGGDKLTLEEKFHKDGIGSIGFKLNRLHVFLAMIVITFFTLVRMPIVGYSALIVLIVFLFVTFKDPDFPLGKEENKIQPEEPLYPVMEAMSLMRVGGGIGIGGGNTELYNKFIDVLIKGGVIDQNTEPDDIVLEVVETNPPTYELSVYQIGKTESGIVSACNAALLAYNAYVVNVEEIGGTNYRISFQIETDIEKLSALGMYNYNQLLAAVEEEE